VKEYYKNRSTVGDRYGQK